MKVKISLLIFVSVIITSAAQIVNPVEKFALPVNLSESSGAIFFNNRLITHNDSGGENKLFELDTLSGLVTRTITISNAINIDWEDLAQDDTSIYIGDIGNNVNGNRTDLKIYKISKSDYLSSETINAQTIAFSYSDQTDFTPATANNTEWDSEAIVSFDSGNLILFSKNWIDGTTKAYVVPKTQGTYTISPLPTTLNSGGLISGGTYNPLTEKLFLVGYTNLLQPFIWRSEGFNGNDIFSGSNTQTLLSSFGFEQTEGITYVNENRYFITSESFTQSIFSDYAKLIAFSTNDISLDIREEVEVDNILWYPNPVNDFLHIENIIVDSVEIYDTKLMKLYTGKSSSVDMSSFNQGIYIVIINKKEGFPIIKKIIKN